ADFRNAYYPAGNAVRHGESLSSLIASGVMGFVNLPIVAYLFVPLTVLPWRVAALGPFLFAGLAATVSAYIVLTRLAGLSQCGRLWLALLFLFNGPLIYSLKEGNTSQFVLLAFAGALYLLRSGRSAWAGFVLAAAALLKLPLLLFGGFFVLRRDWAGTAAFSGTLGAAAVLSVVVFGPTIHAEWLDTAILQLQHSGLASFNAQSISAWLLRLRHPAPPLFDWTLLPLTPAEEIEAKAAQFALLALAGFGLWRSARVARDNSGHLAVEMLDLQFLLVLVVALVVTPLAWSHYFCWTLIPAAFLLGGRIRPASAACLGWVAVALTTPLVIYPGPETLAPMPGIYTKLAASNYFLGGVAWLVSLIMAAHAPSRASSPANR
ncbi:MAG: DUF2029 domain-containing protein, partial [Acetobacteraceae bacterium]|nr:DUF2029 domain-containing protein [Acetobacteraceae bacterium]